MSQTNRKPWRMHSQTVDEALKLREPKSNPIISEHFGSFYNNCPEIEEMKMDGSKRVRNPDEKFFVWMEDTYGSPIDTITECDTLVEALEAAGQLDEQYDDGDNEIVVVRGERIPIKKRAEFIVDTD